jgi:hypothetical protein
VECGTSEIEGNCRGCVRSVGGDDECNDGGSDCSDNSFVKESLSNSGMGTSV